MIFLTSRDLRKILQAKGPVEILEFNLRKVKVDPNKVKPLIKKSHLKDEESYFVFDGESLRKFGFFSGGLYYKLVPTKDAPALEISGTKMHRVVGTTPWEDARRKVEVLKPKGGKLLDCCTGLGYTAIWASRYCEKVITVEVDENVIEIARINPWSRELFKNPKIELIIGDVKEVIKDLPEEEFDYIMHDPPKESFDRYLYSRPFYRELFRVLKRGGKGYVYTGRGKGSENVIKRIREVGFEVKTIKELDGVLISKPL